ncbi:band 7 protein AGAP004871-like [Mya arenaria]|uniref:band 7 protein AGAP004871-like n=1 Tax=Mya arenaria TaxID=6604 RepID=UPI0022E2AEDE|nr:band 7 protein AGAP004871-like [Mya arenaria]XP_052789990.1 band 7 protein AGAP004871-like [Mya arenaria]
MGRDREVEPDGDIGCCGYILMGFSILILIIFFPFSLICSIKIVQEYERAVIFRLGRVLSGGAKGPGLFFLLPCVDSSKTVDLRTFSYDIPPQEILSRDSVTVAVDAVIYARIFDATMSIINIENAHASTRLLAATTLRNVLGTKELTNILTDRESIAHQMQVTLDEATDPWGVKVERVEVKDVRLPVQMQRAMAAEAESTRDARAKVILAEGEKKASRSLKEASDILSQSPTAIQIRYLQTLNSIAAERNSTIIFPLPIDMLGMGKSGGGSGGSYKSGGSKSSNTSSKSNTLPPLRAPPNLPPPSDPQPPAAPQYLFDDERPTDVSPVTQQFGETEHFVPQTIEPADRSSPGGTEMTSHGQPADRAQRSPSPPIEVSAL